MSKNGSLEVICGSMFSGKSEELIRRVKRTLFANKKVIIFKPSIDQRYSADEICSHAGNRLEAVNISSAFEINGWIPDGFEVVAIDEVQFFDDGILEVIDSFIEEGVRVIVSGLDMDYLGNPFGVVPQLMAKADDVTKLHAICSKCGDDAVHSARVTSGQDLIDIGETDKYIPLCRTCFQNHINK